MDRLRHHEFLPRLAQAGLAPAILHIDASERCLERCETFVDWRAKATPERMAVMRAAVIGLVRSMHGLGVCHRDLHGANLVVRADCPLVIDVELAVEVDPAWPCYDFYGPSAEVPVAEVESQPVVFGQVS